MSSATVTRSAKSAKSNFSSPKLTNYRYVPLFKFEKILPCLPSSGLVELRIDQHVKTQEEIEAVMALFERNNGIRDVQMKFRNRKGLYQ
jgi:hypothetical protein